jgi:predicted N-acyltransferase
MMNLNCQWAENVSQIKEEEWIKVFGVKKIVKSYSFTQAVEKSSLAGFQTHYMLVYQDTNLIAILSCFIYCIEIEALANDWIRNIVTRVRKAYPNFLMVKILGVGSPVATCENHVGFITDIDPEQKSLIGEFILKELTAFSMIAGSDILVVKEIPDGEIGDFKDFFKTSFNFYESLPNSFVPIAGDFSPYPSALKQKYKQRFNYAIKAFEKNKINWEIITDFSTLTGVAHNLYLNVYKKSRYKFEMLNEQFFKSINEYIPQNSFLLVAKNDKGSILAVELILQDKDSLVPLYLGMNYQEIGDTKAYQNVIFRSIIEAGVRCKDYVVLGQTSYLPKSYSGCLFEKLYIGVYFNKKLSNLILKKVFPYLFPTFNKPRSYCYNMKYIDKLNVFMHSINRTLL